MGFPLGYRPGDDRRPLPRLPMGLRSTHDRRAAGQHPLGHLPAPAKHPIDHVFVHELAHLREANQTPEFWAIVGDLMRDYESQKTNFASVDRGVWLGAALGGEALPPRAGRPALNRTWLRGSRLP